MDGTLHPPSMTLDEAIRALVGSIRPTWISGVFMLDMHALSEVRRLLPELGQTFSPTESHAAGMTVHLHLGGFAICQGKNPMRPEEWPEGHCWIRYHEEGANCPTCLDIRERERAALLHSMIIDLEARP